MSKITTRFLDLANQKFGMLTVIRYVGCDEKYNHKWLCECECGNETIVTTGNLRKGHTTSCGCYRHKRQRDSHITHGMSSKRLYQTWQNMKNRCYNPNVESYKYYGERGIKVCEEWLESFETFADWSLENGYNDTLTIDRVNVDGNYEPNNCRWIDEITQANNKRTSVLLEYSGKKQTITDWAREIGINAKVLRRRYYLGWETERILTTPVGADKWH